MEGKEDQRGWLGTKSKCSPRPPPGIHVTLGPKMERDQDQHVLSAGFGLHARPTCNDHHNLIQTLFGTFFIWLEMKFHRSSNGTGLMLKSYLRRQESSKQVDVQNLSGCCVTVFWDIGMCIMSEPMGARPRVGAGPPTGPGRAPTLS
jgi:hypothetical protein